MRLLVVEDEYKMASFVRQGLDGGRVTLSLHRCGTWVSLQVSDPGIGLCQAKQERVSQR